MVQKKYLAASCFYKSRVGLPGTRPAVCGCCAPKKQKEERRKQNQKFFTDRITALLILKFKRICLIYYKYFFVP